MNIPTFPKPSDVIADGLSRGAALIAYVRGARAVLRDGTVVLPRIGVVSNVVDMYRDHGIDFPVAVGTDDYIVVES